MMKTVGGEEFPAGDFLVVEDAQSPDSWHLQVKRHGKPDHNLMGDAHAALLDPKGFRGRRYEGPNKAEAIRKLKALYAAEKLEWPGGSAMGELDGKWIEVFRTGDYGEKGTYGREDLDKVIANYDAAFHQAPVVIGHPKDDAPAYGWVSALRREGDVLQGQLDQIDQGFADLVKAGRFNKRSVALYNDLGGRGLYLRHIGFLGAQPPEVKGLKSVFHDADASGFVEINPQEDLQMDKEEIKRTFGEVLREWAQSVGLVKKPADPPVKSFSEAEVEQAKKDAAAAEKTRLEAEFAEAKRKSDAEAARKQTARAFITDQEKCGRWTPALDKAGLREFLESLSAEATVEFGEAGKTQKKSPFDLFKAFFESLPRQIEFKELAGGKNAKGKTVRFNEAGGLTIDPHSLAVKARAEEIAAERKITFAEALPVARQELGEQATA